MITNRKKQAGKINSNSDKYARLEAIIVSENVQQWPESWAGSAEDIFAGQKLLPHLKLFLQKQIERNLAEKTIKRHAQYLWALGGEIIREINLCEEDRHKTGKEILLKYIHESGGPYWRHAIDEADHQKYDSVCKRLYKLVKNA